MSKQLSSDTRAAMDRVTTGLETKSDKIRALGDEGFERADIARYLAIRYQHVRNVLLKAAEKREKESAQSSDTPPGQIRVQVGKDGRVVIPAAYRCVLGVEDGGNVLMSLEEGEVRMVSREAAIARAQAIVAPYLKDESSSVDAFLADRRREARREFPDD